MSSDWGFNQIRSKADKGQFLSETEKQYFDVEARNAAQSMFGRLKGRGGIYAMAVASMLDEMGRELREKELRKEQEQPSEQKPTRRVPSIGSY